MGVSEYLSSKMANRPKGFGMTAELANKKAAKYDAQLAGDAITWMCEVLKDAGEEPGKLSSLGSNPSSADVASTLKDGTLLCKVINAIKPGSVKKINDSKLAFKVMENTSNFLI